ncbi:MAG: Kdo hydroxylase family protein, partial [Gammaproteobacteria bacterium]|nr:Kdo hydroxylase family protein [Gammaproteobacteria bacterium]
MAIRIPEAVEVNPAMIAKPGDHELSDHLERGRVLIFPTPPIELPSEEDIRFLRECTPEFHTRKNVSYYPQASQLRGIKAPAEIQGRTKAILRDYQIRVERRLQQLIPSLARGWTSATTSLRVFEEADRSIPLRSRSDRLHLDAGTYGASRGDLILRFFTNLSDEDRVWKCKGTAPDLIETLGEAAGIRRGNVLRDSFLNRVGTGLIRGVAPVFPLVRVLEQSAYDQAMRRMHNYMKASEEFHRDPEGMVQIRFKPRSCWMVFADMAGHACESGQFALINTFMVPRQNFRSPEFTPWEALRRFGARESALVQ